jgi:tetratricopeptide (TPR) repeat protein
MGDTCSEAVAAAEQLNGYGEYADALAAFDALVEDCGTRDARERINAGRARALNGMGRHEEAIVAAEATLDAYDENLFGFYERAYAEEQLGDMEAATADYNRVIELTEKNENVAERATLHAYLANLYHQSGKIAEADSVMATAMELDPANPDFLVIQGDWGVRDGDYDAAFAAYDRALEMGADEAELYRIRAQARLKMVQDKYGTTNAQELRGQMTPEETEQVCSELGRALELGMQDMQLDLFAALVCR